MIKKLLLLKTIHVSKKPVELIKTLYMNKKTFFAAFFVGCLSSFAQVGINTTSPQGALDVISTNSGVIFPRVANVDAVIAPVNGMVIYDEAEKCFKGYADDSWKDITPCTPLPPDPAVFTIANPTYQGVSVIDATGIGYNGEAVPAASTITVQATTTSAGSYTLTATDLNTGLVYSKSGVFETAGTFPVVLTPNTVVIPEFFSGIMSISVIGASNSIEINPRIDIKSIPTSATEVVDVTLGTQTWMDRNLGARRVATAINDAFAYGNFFQWGRPADGHEIVVINGSNKFAGRTFYNTTAQNALATSDTPGYNNFIGVSFGGIGDWRDDNNNNRWATSPQGPCPSGYYVPTTAEWQTAVSSGAMNNNTDAYASVLKLPILGYTDSRDGKYYNSTSNANYWTRSITFLNFPSTNAFLVAFKSNEITTNSSAARAVGFNVRCIKAELALKTP